MTAGGFQSEDELLRGVLSVWQRHKDDLAAIGAGIAEMARPFEDFARELCQAGGLTQP